MQIIKFYTKVSKKNLSIELMQFSKTDSKLGGISLAINIFETILL